MIKRLRKKVNLEEGLLVDMTPMIDITFILLIFFILTANVSQNVYSVKLPKSDPLFQKNAVDSTPVKVTIFSNNTYAVGKKVYTNILDVHSAVKLQSEGNRKIIVIPDAESESGKLISFLTFLEGNGITNVDILIENKK